MLRSTLLALVATTVTMGSAEAQLRSVDQTIFGMD
jgi:hypothetical protein